MKSSRWQYSDDLIVLLTLMLMLILSLLFIDVPNSGRRLTLVPAWESLRNRNLNVIENAADVRRG